MLKRISLLAVLCLPLAAQVRVLATPEPMAVLAALNVKELGFWNVVLCNDDLSAVTIAPEEIKLALPTIRIVQPDIAWTVLTDKRAKSKKAKVAKYLTYAGIGALTVAGFRNVDASWLTPKVVSAIGLGTIALDKFKQQMESELPSLAPFADTLLRGPVVLGPRACVTKAFFAGKMPNPQPVAAMIGVK